jgi:mRNA deadenylase 3'-5' endonuclease subunit Ccr4
MYSLPQKYFWTSPEYLSWSYREKLILSELKNMDADIMCLQEMEIECFDDFMETLQAEYDGILQNVTNDHPVTNAILVRKSKLRVLRQESRSRALILAIDQATGKDDPAPSTGRRPLYLATVHLQAGIEDDDTRVSQLRSLLKRIHNHVQVEIPEPSEVKTSNETKGDKTTALEEDLPPPIILAGDFNMLSTNPVYRWISHKHHSATTKQQPKVSLHDSGTGMELADLKFPNNVHLLPLKDIFSDMAPIVHRGHDDSNPRQDDHSNPHYHSDSHTPEDGQTVQMTYCGGSVLDYIWTTSTAATTAQPSIEVHQTMVFHPAAFSRERQVWPSKDHPSDHLPIGVDFSWR